MTMSLESELHPPPDVRSFLAPSDDDDADTASQRSISLSSPAVSPRTSLQNPSHRSDTFSDRVSTPYTLDTDLSSEPDDSSTYTHEIGPPETPNTSAAPSVLEEPLKDNSMPTYPPSPPKDDTESIASVASGSSRKARPESMLAFPSDLKLILGIALVDFNHLVGPRIEYSKGEIFEDEEVVKILPFLALPDGAHLSSEDYSYFHLVPSGPNPTTVFGISCNQQIAASALLVKMPDVSRSTVQKAVVVLASKPIFGPIRDKLGVVTTALFNQRDFRELQILDDFASSIEQSVRGQLTESGLYIGTNIRELVHTFRQRTLVLVKALILQKRIMFYGHPVERLCTYQYSLVSLLPGLMQTLDDCGSPPLAARAPTLARPTSLRTSDRKSMMAYMGLPLDIFGKDALFQPYLPLQQLDVAAGCKSWLCGSTNSIVTQRKEIDLFVNTETGVLEFRDPKLERLIALTPADRKWMDVIVKDVNDGWSDEEGRPVSMAFKGSDDYLRNKFEEYISAALASVRYRDFIAKGQGNGVIISGGTGNDANSTDDFNPLWIAEFKNTNAYEVWDRTTDPMLFDIVEPRHPCNEKPSVVADIGLRLQEGIQDLKLEQQLAPAREAVARTISAGSNNLFKAIEGVRDRWNTQRDSISLSTGQPDKRASTPVEVKKEDTPTFFKALEGVRERWTSPRESISQQPDKRGSTPVEDLPPPSTAKPLLLARHSTVDTPPPAAPAKPAGPSWGAGIGSFFSSRLSGIARRESNASMPTPIVTTSPVLSDSPHASESSFLATMSPAGISSPSVFPPTPLEVAPKTAVPAPSPMRSLSLLTPKAPHSVPVQVPQPVKEEPTVAVVSLESAPKTTTHAHQPDTLVPVYQPKTTTGPKADTDHRADTDEASFTVMAL